MLVGIVVVIGVSQINRILGSVLGIFFWIAVAFVGNAAYAKGAQIGLPGLPMSKPMFFGMCAVLGSFQAFNIYHGIQLKRRKALRQQIDDAQ